MIELLMLLAVIIIVYLMMGSEEEDRVVAVANSVGAEGAGTDNTDIDASAADVPSESSPPFYLTTKKAYFIDDVVNDVNIPYLVVILELRIDASPNSLVLTNDAVRISVRESTQLESETPREAWQQLHGFRSRNLCFAKNTNTHRVCNLNKDLPDGCLAETFYFSSPPVHLDADFGGGILCNAACKCIASKDIDDVRHHEWRQNSEWSLYRFAVNLNADTFLSPVMVSVKYTFKHENTSHTIIARKKLVPDRDHDLFDLVGVKLKEFRSHHDTLDVEWQLSDCKLKCRCPSEYYDEGSNTCVSRTVCKDTEITTKGDDYNDDTCVSSDPVSPTPLPPESPTPLPPESPTPASQTLLPPASASPVSQTPLPPTAHDDSLNGGGLVTGSLAVLIGAVVLVQGYKTMYGS